MLFPNLGNPLLNGLPTDSEPFRRSALVSVTRVQDSQKILFPLGQGRPFQRWINRFRLRFPRIVGHLLEAGNLFFLSVIVFELAEWYFLSPLLSSEEIESGVSERNPQVSQEFRHRFPIFEKFLLLIHTSKQRQSHLLKQVFPKPHCRLSVKGIQGFHHQGIDRMQKRLEIEVGRVGMIGVDAFQQSSFLFLLFLGRGERGRIDIFLRAFRLVFA